MYQRGRRGSSAYVVAGGGGATLEIPGKTLLVWRIGHV